MTRREAILSAGAVFLVALLLRVWAASQLTFPRPEDVAYYFGVARNLLEGHGLTTDAIWSFQTPPLSFPRPAFEVWLPLPTFLMAIPMALFGHTFAAAQIASVLTGSLVCVLAWRLGADVAAARSMPVGRARTLAIGAGLTCAVYLPLVLASAQPDSTMPFAVFALGACLLIARLSRRVSLEGVREEGIEAFVSRTQHNLEWRSRQRVLLGILIGLAALTRNEAIWLALVFVIVEWSNVRGAFPRFADRVGAWGINVIPVALVAIITFAPWAFRDWMEFGSPFPGQALTNALSLDGRDIFAWQEQPTLARYLAAGPAKLLELRWTGIVHNLTQVLLLLGVPLSIVGLIGLPSIARRRSMTTSGAAASGAAAAGAAPGAGTAAAAAAHTAAAAGAASDTATASGASVASGAPGEGGASAEADSASIDPLRPLLLFSVITFLVASLVFPVSTTWGTFLHAAGAIHVLLVISALLVLDAVIGWVGRRRGWTNPVAWLGPAFAIAGSLLFSVMLLLEDGRTSRAQGEQYAAVAVAFSGVAADGSGVDLAAEPGPVITDFPIWFAEATRHHTLALPNESIDSVLDLASSFEPPARYLVVDAGNEGAFPATILNGDPRADCFVPVPLPNLPAYPGRLDDILAFRIRCP